MTTPIRPAAATAPASFGDLLREWRQRRRLSQLALALQAGVSQRHLSFIESGRAHASRDMVLQLAAQLDVPLRERNALLLAAGFAPSFPERVLTDPALGAAREAVERVLAGHEPYPALAIDRYWTLVSANRAVAPLLAGVSPELLAPPVNALRLSLHPNGLAPRIANLVQWRTHLLERLEQQVRWTGDAALVALHDELSALPIAHHRRGAPAALASDGAGIFVPLQLDVEGDRLSLISTTTVFGTSVDVTLAELALECFFPEDQRTAEWLRKRM